jgi:hypothetical protein
MKTFFITLVAFSLALIIGCQENLINEPESSSLLKDKRPEVSRIKICCEVKDPEYGICRLNGCVDYTYTIITNKMGPRKITEISLNIYMNSVLCDKLGMVHLEWRAEGRSSEIVTVSEEGILLLEKTYSITNRPDVVLLVKYLVTTNGVGIASVNVVRLEN